MRMALAGANYDYERHILPHIEWESIEAPDPQSTFPERAKYETEFVDVGEFQPVSFRSRFARNSTSTRQSSYRISRAGCPMLCLIRGRLLASHRS